MNTATPSPKAEGVVSSAQTELRRPVRKHPPSRWRTVFILVQGDLSSMARSWLVRGFFLISAIITVLQLKGMQANKDVASQMLEAVYSMYILIWMHAVVFIAGGALAREQDCLGDAILSRGITRGEYMGSKLVARCFATVFLIALILLPASFWAMRQDKLVRTDTGFLSAKAEGIKVEAWEPKKVFSEIDGTILKMEVEIGDSVQAGQVLALIDDRRYFDDLENDRRAEQDAVNELDNAHRRAENARRLVSQAEEAMGRAERGLLAKDLFSKLEQADKAADLRIRKRELTNAENDMRVAQDNILKAERAVATARSKVLTARKRLSHTTIVAPVSGFITERPMQASQNAGVGGHICTVAPLDDYQLRVPVYNFKEFQRLKTNYDAFITIRGTEYKGKVERLGAMTEADRWGRQSNYGIVRFRGEGTLGLMGLDAAVRIALPPSEKPADRATAILNTLTGRNQDDLNSRTASVTTVWMLIALGKVLGCACFLVTLTLFFVVVFRNSLIAILSTIGFWHISNLIFDFAGLPSLSYLEIVRTMDKVLGGIATITEELATLGWLGAFAASLAALSLVVFISKDPQK